MGINFGEVKIISYQRFSTLVEQKGLTAYRVSKDTGVAQSTLSDWKRGKSIPKVDKLKKIADYLGVTLDYLLDREETDDSTMIVVSIKGQTIVRTIPTQENERFLKLLEAAMPDIFGDMDSKNL